MKRTFAALVAAIVAPLSAHAVPIAYEFSATIDSVSYNSFGPIPADIQATFAAFMGASVSGTFSYESDLGPPVLMTPGIGNFYNGGLLDFAASVGGYDIASAVGSLGVQSVGQDRLVLSAFALPPPGSPIPPPPVFGHILGYEVRGSNFAWVEGVPQPGLVPPFLTDNTPPLALPSYPAQFLASLWVPGVVPTNPIATTNVTLSTLNATVRRATVPEPGSLALLALGIAGAVVARRRATMDATMDADRSVTAP